MKGGAEGQRGSTVGDTATTRSVTVPCPVGPVCLAVNRVLGLSVCLSVWGPGGLWGGLVTDARLQPGSLLASTVYSMPRVPDRPGNQAWPSGLGASRRGAEAGARGRPKISGPLVERGRRYFKLRRCFIHAGLSTSSALDPGTPARLLVPSCSFLQCRSLAPVKHCLRRYWRYTPHCIPPPI